MTNAGTLTFYDYEPKTSDFRGEVLAGLGASPKRLPCKFFYDEKGSKLFDAICELDEYYPTRTETSILRSCAGEAARLAGGDCMVVEYGSGSSAKTPVLLEAFDSLDAYVPVDISREHLIQAAERLTKRFPGIRVVPICADYTADFNLPKELLEHDNRLVFFPGSTIGNLLPGEALDFLIHMREVCGRGGRILIGVDLIKDESVLRAAYNDREGVTAAFNLNLLSRINRELGADFNMDQFAHEARFNRELGRMEMHLVSLESQTVSLNGERFSFAKGESIHTENSHKYTLERFEALAAAAGLDVERVWTDPNQWFSLQMLKPKA